MKKLSRALPFVLTSTTLLATMTLAPLLSAQVGPDTKPDPAKTKPQKEDPKKPDPKKEEADQDKKTGDKKGDKKSDPDESETDKKKPKKGKGDQFVGPNTPLDLTQKTFFFEEGPFKDLELYGYSFFASARAGVELKRQIQANPGQVQDTESINALKELAGPMAMSGANVNLPAPDRYQLGPGDKLVIRVSSETLNATEKTLTVDPRGALTVAGLANPIVVRGLTIAGAEKTIQERLRRVYKGAEVSLTLNELRSMSITVVGEVVAQGNYQVPSVMTLFNAIYMAGGPTPSGSMRRIQLRRANGEAKNIDLYKLIQKGDSSQDVPLQPGDLILVPLATNLVALKGEFGRPGVYEIAPGEKLKDAVAYAGGAKPSAVVDRVSILSVQAGQERQVSSVNLATQNPALQDYDIVELFSVRQDVANAVFVDGAVDQPRMFPLVKGMTVADLLERSRGFLPEAFTKRADLIRTNSDGTLKLVPIDLQKVLARDPEANIRLEAKDRLKVYFEREIKWTMDRQVELLGAVQRPSTYYRADGMRVSDLLLQAGGLLPEAYADTAFLRRKAADRTEGPLLKLNLRKILSAPGSADDVALQDLDELTVYKIDEAKYVAEQVVNIQGAVLRPGLYPRSAGMTVKDLVDLAGGLLPNAGTEVQVSHARVPEGTKYDKYSLQSIFTNRSNPQLQDGDVVAIPGDGEILLKPITVAILGRVKRPGVYAITRSTEKISDLIERAGGLLEDGWIEGAQFARDPKFIATDAQVRLTPRVQELLQTVQQQEYLRALAKSDIDKLKAIANSQQSGLAGLPIPGLGGVPAAPPAPNALPTTKLDQRETVSPARQLTDTELETGGNIPVRLASVLKDAKSEDNLVLRDGDILQIPERPNTVSVKGAVTVPGTILFESGKTLGFYLDNRGGLTSDADLSQVLIIRASGTITKAKRSTKVMLGDTIYVPTKVMVAKLGDGNSFESIVKSVTSAGLVYAIFRSILP